MNRLVTPVAALAAALALGACASRDMILTNSRQVAKVDSKGRLMCITEPSLGSHLRPKTVCMTKEQYKEWQEANAQSIRALEQIEQNDRQLIPPLGL